MTEAQRKLDLAMAALDKGDFNTAFVLAREVGKMWYHKPPYPTYTLQQMRDAITLERWAMEQAIAAG